jgi:hypothetical protein
VIAFLGHNGPLKRTYLGKIFHSVSSVYCHRGKMPRQNLVWASHTSGICSALRTHTSLNTRTTDSMHSILRLLAILKLQPNTVYLFSFVFFFSKFLIRWKKSKIALKVWYFFSYQHVIVLFPQTIYDYVGRQFMFGFLELSGSFKLCNFLAVKLCSFFLFDL